MKNDEMEREFKNLNIELKSVQEGKNLFIEGYAAVFGNLDSYRDIIQLGAFAKTITGSNGKRIRFCYQHDFDKVIGKIVELREDTNGLYFKAKISNTTLGKDVAELVMDEALNEISIGYRTMLSEYNEVTDERKLMEVELYEISIVTRAANEEATIQSTEVKSEKKADELTDDELIQKKKEIDTEINKRILNKILNK